MDGGFWPRARLALGLCAGTTLAHVDCALLAAGISCLLCALGVPFARHAAPGQGTVTLARGLCAGTRLAYVDCRPVLAPGVDCLLLGALGQCGGTRLVYVDCRSVLAPAADCLLLGALGPCGGTRFASVDCRSVLAPGVDCLLIGALGPCGGTRLVYVGRTPGSNDAEVDADAAASVNRLSRRVSSWTRWATSDQPRLVPLICLSSAKACEEATLSAMSRNTSELRSMVWSSST